MQIKVLTTDVRNFREEVRVSGRNSTYGNTVSTGTTAITATITARIIIIIVMILHINDFLTFVNYML